MAVSLTPIAFERVQRFVAQTPARWACVSA
jgi:hypothetical protein